MGGKKKNYTIVTQIVSQYVYQPKEMDTLLIKKNIVNCKISGGCFCQCCHPDESFNHKPVLKIMSLIVSVGGAMALKFMSMGMWHASEKNYC